MFRSQPMATPSSQQFIVGSTAPVHVRRVLRLPCVLVALWLILGSLLPAFAKEQIAVPESAQAAVSSGSQLERDRKWRDAIDLYKKSVERWPGNEQLTYALRRTQFQFSIDRRYSDRSFRETMLTLPREGLVGLYGDILEQLQQHYVESIDTTSLAAHGTESLWLALSNEKFLERNLFGASPDRIKKLRLTLRDKYWNRPVAQQMGARQLVQEVCALAHQTVGLDSGPVLLEYIFGACNCLDDYSNVLTPGRLHDLYNNIDGEFVGIGIVMEADIGKGAKIVQVLPESPASEAGLRPADVIAAIDGKDIRYMATDESASLLSGQNGSGVKLEIVRSNDSFAAQCTRREVKVKSIPIVKIVDVQEKIGYIQMSGFQKGTSAELDAALADLTTQGVKSVIWDVRGNPGGLLTAAVEVLDRFIEEGVLVSTRGRSFDQNFSYSAHRQGTSNLPLILLIDGNSASASEIVAGAIQDHHRGKIVGRKSFGKWSVQSIYNVSHSAGLRVTTAKFYSPDGHNWSKVGITPDVTVAETEHTRGDFQPDTDADIQTAIKILRGQEDVARAKP